MTSSLNHEGIQDFPTVGDLRWHRTEDGSVQGTLTLQVYRYSYQTERLDWYDVPIEPPPDADRNRD